MQVEVDWNELLQRARVLIHLSGTELALSPDEAFKLAHEILIAVTDAKTMEHKARF